MRNVWKYKRVLIAVQHGEGVEDVCGWTREMRMGPIR
jgi:hypothetical protein